MKIRHPISRFFAIFLIVLMLMIVVEVLPLLFGSSRTSWGEVAVFLRQKALRLMIIATMVAAVVVRKGDKSR